jgi:hypothetical protein
MALLIALRPQQLCVVVAGADGKTVALELDKESSTSELAGADEIDRIGWRIEGWTSERQEPEVRAGLLAHEASNGG